jgi:hypothetical protein
LASAFLSSLKLKVREQIRNIKKIPITERNKMLTYNLAALSEALREVPPGAGWLLEDDIKGHIQQPNLLAVAPQLQPKKNKQPTIKLSQSPPKPEKEEEKPKIQQPSCLHHATSDERDNHQQNCRCRNRKILLFRRRSNEIGENKNQANKETFQQSNRKILLFRRGKQKW